jgi:hypothetical protein
VIEDSSSVGALPKRYDVMLKLKHPGNGSVYKAFTALQRDFSVVPIITFSRTRGLLIVYDMTILGLIELLQKPGLVRPPLANTEATKKLFRLAPGIFCAWERLENAGLAKLAWKVFAYVCTRHVKLPTLEETRDFQRKIHHPFYAIRKGRPDLFAESDIYEHFYHVVLQLKGSPPSELYGSDGSPEQFRELRRILLEDQKIALLCAFILLKEEELKALNGAETSTYKIRFAGMLDPSFHEWSQTLLKPLVDEGNIMGQIRSVESKLREYGLDLGLSAGDVARKLILGESPWKDDYLIKSGETLGYIVSDLERKFGEDLEDELEGWLSNPEVWVEYLKLLESLGIKGDADFYNLRPEDQAQTMTKVFRWILQNARKPSLWKRLQRKTRSDLRHGWLFRAISGR